MSNDDIFAPDHVPDPVATKAAQYAVEVTDHDEPHPIWNKFVIIAVIFLVIAGTFGAIIGTINTVSLQTQNSELKKQQVCNTQLLKVITTEQQARANIAADDRKAIKDLVASVSRAKTPQDVQRAFTTFNQESVANDKRRALFPVPNVDENVCAIKPGSDITSSNSPTATVTPSKSVLVPKPKTSSVPNGGGNNAPKVPSGSTRTVPGPTRTVTKTRTVKPPKPTIITIPPIGVPIPPIPVVTPLTNPLCSSVPIVIPIFC